MRYIIKWGSVLIVLGLLSGCTSFETEESLYAEKEEVIETEIDTLDDELVDIDDDEIALGGLGFITESFNVSDFTGEADAYTDRLMNDIDEHLNGVGDYDQYLEVAKVPKDDLMAVVNIELEYMMQYDQGTWTDRRSDYLNGEGYSVSSFENVEGIYNYDITYNDQTGAYKVIKVRYDSVLERYDYTSESFNEAGVLSYAVRQQFCRDDEGGYYYQAVRQGVVDGFERVAFSHFNTVDYTAYIRPATQMSLAKAFPFDLYEEVPDSIDMLTDGIVGLQSFSNQKGKFDYKVVEQEVE